MTQILELIGFLPKIVSLVERAYERYKKNERIQRENKRRRDIEKAMEETDEALMRKTLADTLSNIRRNVD